MSASGVRYDTVRCGDWRGNESKMEKPEAKLEIGNWDGAENWKRETNGPPPLMLRSKRKAALQGGRSD